MLKFLKTIRKNKKRDSVNFFNLPSYKQKKIIKKAAKEANEEQLELIKKYELRKMVDCR